MTTGQSEFREMNCDWCGEKRECGQWQKTHYMICLRCATSGLAIDWTAKDLGDGE